LMNEGLWSASREELERAASLFRGASALLDNNWGCYYFRQKEYAEAIRFFRKAMERSPTTGMYRRNLAQALKEAGSDIEAAEALDAFSLTHPHPGELQELILEPPQEGR